jgi:pyridoxal phosphate enzyme (YggS family)
VTGSGIAERLRAVRERIAAAEARAGRAAGSVRLVAVSKTQPVEAVRAAYAAGARDFGENYAAELAEKIAATHDLPEARWHFIGHLQTNKVKLVAGAALVHGVDSARLVGAIAARFADRVTPVLVQVSLAGEEQKSGASRDEVPAILEAIAATGGRVVARGLMTMPPLTEDPEQVRPVFRALRELRDALGGPVRLPELSMGMSGDYEVAIEEGATLVRVGTAIFGERTIRSRTQSR